MKTIILTIKVLALLSLGLLLVSANAQTTYSTIADGDWADFAIWSTDVESPCYCVPPSKLIDTKVNVRHRVSSQADIVIGNKGTIIIDVTGSMALPAATLNVEEGSLIAYGRLSTHALDICESGRALIAQPGYVATAFEVNGTLDMIFQAHDTFNVSTANVNVNYGATVGMQNAVLFLRAGDLNNQARIDMNNAIISLPLGDIRNDGMIVLSMGCLSASEGDFYNTGTLSGEGAINVAGALISDVGEISGIDWCASEWYTSDEEPDCVGATILCGNIGSVKPGVFNRMDVSSTTGPEGIEISWTVDGEHGVQLYEVQKATSNFMFFPIAWVDPSADQQYHKTYSCIDNNPAYEVIYYRVAVWDSEGATHYSNVVHVGRPVSTPPSI